VLESEGFEVSFAVDGQDALRKVLLEWPALIVLDLDLPLMDGREFLEVRSEHPQVARIPVLVISDGSRLEGTAGSVSRPLVPEQVVASVRRLCGILTRSA
jgi:CheY-like chemotaxis protein